MTIEGSKLVKGRGLIALGVPSGTPLPGAVVIKMPDGTVIESRVTDVEHFRVPGNHWGLLLPDLAELLPEGAVIEKVDDPAAV